MRILTLIHEYPPLGGGGGRVARDVALGLVRLGHEVLVVVPHMRSLSMFEDEMGVHLIRIPSLRRKPFVGDLLAMSGYLFAGFFVGLWLIYKYSPQVIHVHFAVPAGMLAWVLSKLTGVPYVLTSHLGDVPGGVPEKTDRWFKWVYPFTPRIWRDAQAVTAISDFTRQLALAHYPVPIQVVPNGIETGSIPEDIELNQTRQIVFVGRLVAQKNPLAIPQLLNDLRDLDWRCVVLGDGALKVQLENYISRSDMRDRFSLTGWLEPDEVDAILQKSDILFMPSQTEGIPLSGLQALTKGLAIVASNVGGLPHLVEEGKNGFLHEPSDAEGFRSSLRKLITDPELLRRMRRASLEISKRFDIERVVKQYEETLLSAVNKVA